VGDTLGVISLILALGTGAIWYRKILAVEIPQARAAFVTAFAAAAVLGVASFAVGNGTIGGICAGVGISFGALMTGLRAVSAQDAKVPAVRVGDRILDFTAPDEDGQPFSLASLGGRAFLLKFFRGHW
jgi:cytochrome oxidase Cu insertion factor (SCO1/SenC/PrrC family)